MNREGKILRNVQRSAMKICVMLLALLVFTFSVHAGYPPSDASWTLHRGIWENQGIVIGSDSPETAHELWNNTTAGGFTCDPVAARVVAGFLGAVNLVYTATPGNLIAYDAWTGEVLLTKVDATLGEVNQILVDDIFIIVKTPTEIRAYSTDLVTKYWSYAQVIYQYGAHVGEIAGNITPGLNRIQLVQHQVIVGIINGTLSDYTGDSNYNGHRAFRADYDTTELSCIWHRNLNSEVWNTPAIYLNMSTSDYGGNNTTIGSGNTIPGYGTETPLDPGGDPIDVEDRNAIFFTVKNRLYCLRADDGAYSIIQKAMASNASLTNPRKVSPINDQDTYPNPVVVYHMKTPGNNSWGGGDGTWNSGQTPGCDVVFFLTSDGYANGICLYDSTYNYEGMYTWPENAFNWTGAATIWTQSFAADESLNPYNDNPTYNESYLYVGDTIGVFNKITCTDGTFGQRNMIGGANWFFGVDSPFFDEGRVYTLMHNAAGLLKIECLLPGAALATHWNRQYAGVVLSNLTGYWNPEPCLAFDTTFVCSMQIDIPNIWAQRDNEPPVVDCGETIIYPVIGQQYDLYNATASDPDGTITNYTWDLEWGYRYTLDCNFTFWVHQSTTGYLNVTDDDSATASDSFTIIPQLPPPPDVNISWIGRVDILNNTQDFDGSATTGLNLTWWNWSVEDPNGMFWYDNGTNQSIEYTFTIWADTYNVTLNVTDEWDQSGDQSVLVYIYLPDPPTANISWIGRVDILNNTQEFNSSTNSRGTNLTWWNWSVEDPNGIFWYDNGTNQSINYTFLIWSDTYNVTFNLTDEWGQSDNQSVLVYIYLPDPPTANISWNGWAVVNFTETFNGSAKSRGTNLTWWNWTVEHPNGTFWYDNGTNDSIDFKFEQVNETYNLTLNLTDEWGQSNNTTIGVWVYPVPCPEFNWTSKPTSGYVRDSLRYSFTTNNTSYVIWIWGDGNTDNTSDGNATHTWSKWGEFTVTVTIWNAYGVSNTTTFDVTIGLLDLRPLQGWITWLLIIVVVIMFIKFIVGYLSNKGDHLDL